MLRTKNLQMNTKQKKKFKLFKKLSHLIVFIAVYIFVLITRILNHKQTVELGIFIGYFIYYTSKKRRKITYDNLRTAFPEQSEDWINTTSKKSFQNLGITFAEMFKISSLSEPEIRSLVKYRDIDEIDRVHKQGNGIVIISGHFGNWELMAYSFGIYSTIPVSIVVKQQSNRLLNEHLNKMRVNSGNKVVSMHKAAIELIKAIRNNEAIAFLADQSATNDKDLFVNFFNQPTATYKAPAQIALKFRAPIIFSGCIRQPDNTYLIEHNELDYSDIENTPEGIKELTQRHVTALENLIRKYPDQWVWAHRRWKHKPKGEEN